MQKIFKPLLAACLVLTGCSSPSSTWNTVRAVRVDTRDSDDPSAVYAKHLSGVLQAASVEHKIVTYEYRYRTALREEAIGTRTVVIYRDDKSTSNPWWLMDERLYKPVWLPGEDENRQVSFYMRQPATVVSTTMIGIDVDGKRVLGAPAASSNKEVALAVRKANRSARSREHFVKQVDEAHRRTAHSQPPRPTRSKDIHSANGTATRTASLFRMRHGTEFDPASLTDRRKMEQLILASGHRSARLSKY